MISTCTGSEPSEIDGLECRIRLLEARAESKVLGILVQNQLNSKFQLAEPNTLSSRYEIENYPPESSNEIISGLELEPNFLDPKFPTIDFQKSLLNWSASIDTITFRPNINFPSGTLENDQKVEKPFDFRKEILVIRQATRQQRDKLTCTQINLIDFRENMSKTILDQLSNLRTRVGQMKTEKMNFQHENEIIKSKIECWKHDHWVGCCDCMQSTSDTTTGSENTMSKLYRFYQVLTLQLKQRDENISFLEHQLIDYKTKTAELLKSAIVIK